jgi:hypothetical protein
MTARRVLAAIVLSLAVVGLVAAPGAANDNTVLNYSVKDARAFLWQIAYPQKVFISEFYGPCNESTDPYHCDRTAYGKTPAPCGKDALGRTGEATAEMPSEAEARSISPTDTPGDPDSWPSGNPVTVIHGLAQGRLGTSPESGGLASMYYVDNSGRRETEAHVESDGYVGNRHDYEERCAKVDAALEGNMFNVPFAAHVLSRANQQPATYDMTAFTTSETSTYPPGQSKESVSIVKLWQANGRVNGLLTSTVRGFRLADQITVDLVRSIIAFSSDGTPGGLVTKVKTEALGVTIGTSRIAALDTTKMFAVGSDSFMGLAAPIAQSGDDGHRIVIRAPGLFLAANTPLDQIPLPEDPIQDDKNLQPIRVALCNALKQDPEKAPCRLTLGGRLFAQQVVYVAGAILDVGVGRIPPFELPKIPPPPKLPPIPPLPNPGVPPPNLGNTTTIVTPGAPAVGITTYAVRRLAGSPWPLASIVAFSALGLIGVMGRWSLRYPWARSVARVQPFQTFGLAYRAFIKG